MLPSKNLPISCGNILVDAAHMLGNTPPATWPERYTLLPGNRIRLAMNSLYLEIGNKKILIDPGMSPGYSPGENYEIEYAASIADQLKNAGVFPEEVNEVILTHLHFDHCAGIFHYNKNIPQGPAFPSATILFSKEQYTNILDPDPIEKDSFIPDFLFFIEKFYTHKLIDEKEGILTNPIRFKKYSGHSPGMILPFIPTEKGTLVYTSDLIPLAINAERRIVSTYDLDMEKSLAEMNTFLEEAAEKRYELFLYHELNNPIFRNY